MSRGRSTIKYQACDLGAPSRTRTCDLGIRRSFHDVIKALTSTSVSQWTRRRLTGDRSSHQFMSRSMSRAMPAAVARVALRQDPNLGCDELYERLDPVRAVRPPAEPTRPPPA